MQIIAHKTEDGREQPLIEHCRNVSKMASAFAKPFNGEKIAEQAGLNHDAGKDTDGFQRYIHDPEHNPKCPHSVIGAVICEKTNDAVSAAIIEGHHAGLHNIDSMLENVNVYWFSFYERQRKQYIQSNHPNQKNLFTKREHQYYKLPVLFKSTD